MKYKLKLNLEYEVEAENEEDALCELEDRFASGNTMADREFWDNIKIKKVGGKKK
jgi:hypothetical protein